jgi:hypothetical protein
MAEIKNYTLNFGCGRALCGIDFADAKSSLAGAKPACAEVQRDLWLAC